MEAEAGLGDKRNLVSMGLLGQLEFSPFIVLAYKTYTAVPDESFKHKTKVKFIFMSSA